MMKPVKTNLITDNAPELPEKIKGQETLVPSKPVKEIGGPAGLEPTRYGDWERKGRCIDF